MQNFRLAPMSRLIFSLTVGLLALPIALLAGASFQKVLLGPVLLLLALYAWVWLRFRPTHFVVHPDMIEVVWPLKRRVLRRSEISAVQVIEAAALRRALGWSLRVGAGGLWGGFGWLWTERRGVVQMYVSRTDRFVWIERGNARPWLITPEQPDDFVRALMS